MNSVSKYVGTLGRVILPKPFHSQNRLLLTRLVIFVPIIYFVTLCLCASVPYDTFQVCAKQHLPCLQYMDPSDGILVKDFSGKILLQQNASQKYIPASTLKLITALAAIHHLGLDHKFRTEFYLDLENNLKIKGYGDPLLISEIWQDMAKVLSKKIKQFNHLILDDAYFSKNMTIPGVGKTTNPYDAPLGAMCANFNTIFFDHDNQGQIVSAEPQTPMTPYAIDIIRRFGLIKGRYTFTHSQDDAGQYAAEIFLHFINENGVKNTGRINKGRILKKDRLVFTYESPYPLSEVIEKMMAFSNNFVANQICVSLGAHVFGPPGTLEKGVRVMNQFICNELGLKNVKVVEGAGISRLNRISPEEMLTVLEKFRPYRHLLKNEDRVYYKTGTLKDIRTRVGYMETSLGTSCCFVVFQNNNKQNMTHFITCIKSRRLNTAKP